nr:hypothetical protein Iba_chr15aCG11840 [Ipomoea batatas]
MPPSSIATVTVVLHCLQIWTAPFRHCRTAAVLHCRSSSAAARPPLPTLLAARKRRRSLPPVDADALRWVIIIIPLLPGFQSLKMDLSLEEEIVVSMNMDTISIKLHKRSKMVWKGMVNLLRIVATTILPIPAIPKQNYNLRPQSPQARRPPLTGGTAQSPTAHRLLAACTPHAPIAACTAARLTPSRDSLRHHSYWMSPISIATGVGTRALPFFPQATVQHRSSQQSPSVRLQSPVGSG